METDRLKELLELIKENVTNTPDLKQSGICKQINVLWLDNACNLTEKKELQSYLNDNKPTEKNQYAIFTQTPYWTNGGAYWWLPIHSDIYHYSFHTKEIRINYLTELINNIK